eukprot:3261762-Prymnesium_polylepis.1
MIQKRERARMDWRRTSHSSVLDDDPAGHLRKRRSLSDSGSIESSRSTNSMFEGGVSGVLGAMGRSVARGCGFKSGSCSLGNAEGGSSLFGFRRQAGLVAPE